MTEHETLRRQAWIAVAAAVAGCANARSDTIPGKWANRALADFDAAFPAPEAAPEQPQTAPRVTRSFDMAPQEVQEYLSIERAHPGVDQQTLVPRMAQELQRFILELFERRGVLDARMPCTLEVSEAFGHKVYTVSECRSAERPL